VSYSKTIPRTKLRRAAELKVRRCEDNSLPYVGLENVESKTGRYLEGINEMPDAVANEFVPGDVLFGKLRPYLAKSLAPEFHGRCSGELLVLRPKTLEPRFLHYWLLSDETISAVSASTYGAKMPRADWEFIGNLEIPLPPLALQRRIAAHLDRETARIDALVAEKEALLRLLEEKRASLISHAVTRGLNPKAKLKPSGIPWLGDVPENWEVKELRYLVDPKRQVMYGIVLPGPHVEDGVPIIKGGDVRPHRLNPDTLSRTTFEIAEKHARSAVREGDILFSIRGSIGDVAVVPAELHGANITQDAARIAPRDGIDRDWLFWALQSGYAYSSLEVGSLGAAVRGINIRDLKRLWLPVPPVAEQRQIGATLTSQIGNTKTLVADIQTSIHLLREKRTSLISAAVTGEMAVG
jgi:type I restriction enzyme S subunit